MDNMDQPIPPPVAPPAAPPVAPQLSRLQHWHKVRRMTGLLLLLWLLTGFGAAFFARELAGLSVFGWPLSFYLAAQGASLVYLAILAFYAWRMRRLDRAAASATPEPRA
jgi:putative solute:sodium symporter small subunit